MKVFQGNYPSTFSPYKLAEILCFWAAKKDENGFVKYPDWVEDFGEWMDIGKVTSKGAAFSDDPPRLTRFSKLIRKIGGNGRRKIKVKIDYWDTYSLDHTLAVIIAPCLRALRDHTLSSGFVDNSDVPRKLWRPKDAELGGEDDPHLHDRWHHVMDEMIFAFEMIAKDDFGFETEENNKRVKNGLRLFGKYYQSLWN